MIRVETYGPVTLIEGDCLKLVPELDLRADHVFADPAYEEILHLAAGGSSIRRTDGHQDTGVLDFAPIDAIRPEYVRLFEGRVAGWFMNFCTLEGIGRWADEINASQMKYKRACVWHKTDYKPQMNGQGPAFSCEAFVAAWAGKGYSKWNRGGHDGHYEYPSKARSRDGRHKCEKPLPLLEAMVRDFTQPGDLILDPFMGSGSMALACLATGRRFIGIELQPHYFDICIERVEGFRAAPRLFDPFDRPIQSKMNLTTQEAAE